MNRLVIELVICSLLVVSSYFFGVSNESNKWELILKTEQKKQLEDYVNKIQIQAIHTQTVLNQSKTKEKEAWGLYETAEQNYTDAVSNNTSLRVRIKQCTTTTKSGNLHNSTTSTDLGNGASEGQAELSDSAKRGIAEVGLRADRCEAKLVALQGYVDTLAKTCLVTTIKE